MEIPIGKRFERLVIVSEAERSLHGKPCVVCRCDCGAVITKQWSNLRYGLQKSCGCYRRDVASTKNLTHGHTRLAVNGATAEYNVWTLAKGRCSNPRNASFVNYGGRGITMCDRWVTSFEAFLQDMGPRPSPSHMLDRTDNDGPYDPANCRWVTRQTQNQNKRSTRWITHNGETLCVADWARRYGFTTAVLHGRLRMGWSFERSITEPVHPHNFNQRRS